jgi:hypothetical protein
MLHVFSMLRRTNHHHSQPKNIPALRHKFAGTREFVASHNNNNNNNNNDTNNNNNNNNNRRRMTLTVVVGSSGSGKTTFLNEVHKRHKSVYVRKFLPCRASVLASFRPGNESVDLLTTVTSPRRISPPALTVFLLMRPSTTHHTPHTTHDRPVSFGAPLHSRQTHSEL